MYTGIVQGLEKVVAIHSGDNFKTLFVSDSQGFLTGVLPGASVAINGTCLTVSGVDADTGNVAFDVSALTAAATTLQYLQRGDDVNVERSAKNGMENGGHNLYGHVAGMATVQQVERTGSTVHLDIRIPDGDIRYFF